MRNADIAVIGAGYWGRNLVRNFAELGALRAICDPAPAAEDLARTHGVARLDLGAALADPAVKGVAIATPAETHRDIALQAFAAGKHVFVEKPIALTVKDGEVMQAAAEKAGRTLMVGHLLRYHPAFMTLLDLVRAGGLGPLRYAYSHRLSLGKFRIEENALWSFAPHDLSMLLALFDAEPTRVTATGGAFVTPGVQDEHRLDLEFPGGGRAHVFASWLHPFKEHRLVVVGQTAMAVFEDSAARREDKLRLYRHEIVTGRGAPDARKAEVQSVDFPDAEPLKEECRHFLDCVDGKARPRTDAREALAVLRVLEQAG